MKSDFVVRESIPDAMAVQQAIVDASPLPSVIVRCSDGAILCANQGYIELLGLAPRTVLDGNVVDGHADADEWAAIVEHLESAEPVCGLRAAIKTSGGATVSTAVAAKLLTHAGEPAVICSYFDISEQKQIEKLGIHFALVSPTFGFRGCDDRRLGPCRGPARAAPPAGAVGRKAGHEPANGGD